MMKQMHVYVKGDVIGVGFRAWVKIQSKIHSVNGWVRNAFDKEEIFGRGGGVEALLQGDQSQLEEMAGLLREGPPVARVDDVEIYWQDPRQIFEGFEIRK